MLNELPDLFLKQEQAVHETARDGQAEREKEKNRQTDKQRDVKEGGMSNKNNSPQ